ncbi:defensin-like protein 1 [Cornus florida]|uniref:defensin-like protein 1 n=1 Tax=Cornus florida TaxID=4283 RepID=UPI00289E3B11|nr:defensin-like protein 1 [Cornus florida]
MELEFSIKDMFFIACQPRNLFSKLNISNTCFCVCVIDDGTEEARMVVVVVARTCESQSHHFKGPCLSDHNCGLVCRDEGFGNGWCRGVRHRCFCTKPC